VLESEYQPRRRLPRQPLPPTEPEPVFSFEIRRARPEDIPDIREIYNHYVTNSVVTFDEKPMTIRAWKAKFAFQKKLGHPVLVAVSPSEQVLGYALVQPWRPRSGYRFTVENAIYLRPASTGKGLGSALLDAMIVASEEAGLKTIIAVISDSGAEASLSLHASAGFVEVGRMGGVGYKFNRSLGTVTLQKTLKPSRRKKSPADASRKPRTPFWRRSKPSDA
jgi:L-amino acid N-acyltransferase YncA